MTKRLDKKRGKEERQNDFFCTTKSVLEALCEELGERLPDENVIRRVTADAVQRSDRDYLIWAFDGEGRFELAFDQSVPKQLRVTLRGSDARLIGSVKERFNGACKEAVLVEFTTETAGVFRDRFRGKSRGRH